MMEGGPKRILGVLHYGGAREEHVNEMRLRAYGPRVAAPAKDLEQAIAAL